jgi:hypothetical protein
MRIFLIQMLALESNNRILKDELSRVRQPLIAFEQHDKSVEMLVSGNNFRNSF